MDILDKIILAESSGNLKNANKPNRTCEIEPRLFCLLWRNRW